MHKSITTYIQRPYYVRHSYNREKENIKLKILKMEILYWNIIIIILKTQRERAKLIRFYNLLRKLIKSIWKILRKNPERGHFIQPNILFILTRKRISLLQYISVSEWETHVRDTHYTASVHKYICNIKQVKFSNRHIRRLNDATWKLLRDITKYV